MAILLRTGASSISIRSGGGMIISSVKERAISYGPLNPQLIKLLMACHNRDQLKKIVEELIQIKF